MTGQEYDEKLKSIRSQYNGLNELHYIEHYHPGHYLCNHRLRDDTPPEVLEMARMQDDLEEEYEGSVHARRYINCVPPSKLKEWVAEKKRYIRECKEKGYMFQ